MATSKKKPDILLQSNLVIANSLGPPKFVRYNPGLQ